MTKTVFPSHKALAQAWARDGLSTCYGRAGNMLFEDGVIYSYGTHFAIARFIAPSTVAFTTRGYSSSTTKHKSIVRGVIPRHCRLVWCFDPAATVWNNKEHTQHAITEAIAESLKPRIRQTTRDKHMAHAAYLTEQFNEYLSACPGHLSMRPMRPTPLEPVDWDKLRELLPVPLEAVQMMAEGGVSAAAALLPALTLREKNLKLFSGE